MSPEFQLTHLQDLMRLGVAPEEPLALLSDAVVRARANAVSIEDRIRHFPNCPLCDIRNRAKFFSKRVRRCRAPDPESDLPGSTKFGEEVVVDHMVVSKSSGGKKFLVLIVYDSFSGIINACLHRVQILYMHVCVILWALNSKIQTLLAGVMPLRS